MKFNKFLKMVLFFIFIIQMCSSVHANETMQCDILANYDKKVITINCTSPVKYPQIVTAVMYQSEIESPVVTDYIRIGEALTDENGKASINLILGADLVSKSYKFEVKGNGYQADKSFVVKAKEILSLSDAEAILKNINSASAETIEPYLNQIKNAVDIIFDDNYLNNKSQYLSILCGIRDTDFKKSFLSISQVKEAWNSVQLILSLAKASDGAAVKNLLEKNSILIGVNIDDEDYKKSSDTVCSTFWNLNKSYNTNKGVLSISDIQTIFKQSVAISAINTSSVADMKIYIKRYAKILDIESDLSRYEKLDKTKIDRQLNGKNFRNMAEIKTAFVNAINLLETPSGGGGGTESGSGGGSGKVTSTLNTDIGMNNNAQKSEPFTDLEEQAWAAEGIKALYEMKIVNGFNDGTFKGSLFVKREELIKMIVLAFDLHDKNAECEFADVSENEWYYEYIASAKEAGIVNGREDGTFGVGENITRQDMSVMVYRASKAAQLEFTESVKQEEFTDKAEIEEYAFESIQKLQQSGIINGFGDGTFAPFEGLSRAQAAKVIFELIKRI